MRKIICDSLSRKTMCIINADLWSGKKEMIRPARSEVNITSFTDIRRTYLKRALLECEKIPFNNKTECIFAESNYECCMNLSNRERALLVQDKRVC